MEPAVVVGETQQVSQPHKRSWPVADDWGFSHSILKRCIQMNDTSSLNRDEIVSISYMIYNLEEQMQKSNIFPSKQQMENCWKDFINLPKNSLYLREALGSFLKTATDLWLDSYAINKPLSITEFKDWLEFGATKALEKEIQLSSLVKETLLPRVEWFIAEEDRYKNLVQSPPSSNISLSTKINETLDSQIQAVYLSQRTTVADEERRKKVAKSVQMALQNTGRFMSMLRQCSVELFGSSMSMFGRSDSDADLCLVTRKGKNEIQALQDKYRAKLAEKAEFLKAHPEIEPSYRAQKVLDELEIIRPRLKNALANLEMLESSKDKSKDDSKTLKKLRKDVANLQFAVSKSEEFVDKWSDTQSDAQISSTLYRLKQYTMLENSCAAIKRDKIQSSKVFFAFEAKLKDRGFKILKNVIGARVPIITFVTPDGQTECDMCLDNALAVHNTALLRAYAQVDDRARTLGYVIKHWARQRNINDASKGTLSSYSYVLLAIFFCQKVGILPNLQSSELVAQYEKKVIKNHDVSFCARTEFAREFQAQKNIAAAANASVSELLLLFFDFYLNVVNFHTDVISIKNSSLLKKVDRWENSDNLRCWRMSIEDPFEYDRDVGCVLSWSGQQQILKEFQRALELTSTGGTFDELCAKVDPPLTKAEKKELKKKGKKAKEVAVVNPDRYCQLCKIHTSGKPEMVQHIEGKKHRIKQERKDAAANRNSTTPPAPTTAKGTKRITENELNSEKRVPRSRTKDRGNTSSAEADREKKSAAASVKFKCELCQIVVHSSKTLDDHMQGMRHRNKAAKAYYGRFYRLNKRVDI